MSDALTKLRELASRLPKGLHSDWRYTNHFELTTSDSADGYWWLDLCDGMPCYVNNCETEEGKRRGLLMDIAEEVCRLKDEGLL